MSKRVSELKAAFMEAKKAKGLSPRSLEWYDWILREFASTCPDWPKQPEKVERFLSSASGSPHTRHAYYHALKAFSRWAHRRYGLADFMQLVEQPVVPDQDMRTYDAGQVFTFLQAAKSLRDRALMQLLYSSGLRASAIVELRVSDIGAHTLRVHTKGGKDKQVPVLREVRALLLKLAEGKRPDDYVFTGHKGKMSRFGVYQVMRRYARELGVRGPYVGPHRWRHSMATQFIREGGSMKALSRILLHKSMGTTQRYVAYALDDVIDEYQQHNPLNAARRQAQRPLFAQDAVAEAERIVSE